MQIAKDLLWGGADPGAGRNPNGLQVRAQQVRTQFSANFGRLGTKTGSAPWGGGPTGSAEFCPGVCFGLTMLDSTQQQEKNPARTPGESGKLKSVIESRLANGA